MSQPNAQYQEYSAYKIGNPANLEAIFIPAAGLLCPSLQYRGQELLYTRSTASQYASQGKTTGLPFLYPWANRLGQLEYDFGGVHASLNARDTTLKVSVENYAMHGLIPGGLPWRITDSTESSLGAELKFDDSVAGFSNFPFPHAITQRIEIAAASLTITTTLTATTHQSVPVAFGYHPYLTLPGADRGDWQLSLPVSQHLLLKDQLPTGEVKAVTDITGPLGQAIYDDCYEMPAEPLTISSPDLTISVTSSPNYHYAQIYAPENSQFICLEPMTSPPDPMNRPEASVPTATIGKPYATTFTIDVSHPSRDE